MLPTHVSKKNLSNAKLQLAILLCGRSGIKSPQISSESIHCKFNGQQGAEVVRLSANAKCPQKFWAGAYLLICDKCVVCERICKFTTKKNGQKPRKKRLQQNSVCLDKIFGSISKSFGERSTKSDGQRRL